MPLWLKIVLAVGVAASAIGGVISLRGRRRAELIAALIAGFTPEDLEARVMVPLGVPDEVRSRARAFEVRVRQLVRWAALAKRSEDLIRTAYLANVSNWRIWRLAGVGLTRETFAIVEKALPTHAQRDWFRALPRVSRQICKLEWASSGPFGIDTGGTLGVLVGPDTVLVSEKPDGDAIAGTRVTFDRGSRAYGLAREPVVVETSDFAVLRLDRPAGRDALEGNTAGSRGWALPTQVDMASSDRTVRLWSAFTRGRGGALALDVRYTLRVFIPPGIVFDADWQLVRLHRFGEVGDLVAELDKLGFVWNAADGIRARDARPRGTIDVSAALASFDVKSFRRRDDDPWAEAADDDVSAEQLWSLAEAASVSAYFDPERLEAPGRSCVGSS